MTHDEVVTQIQLRARAQNILTHYCGRAERCCGDRGQPDLILVGAWNVAWVEVKSRYADLAPDQTTWFHTLRGSGQVCEILNEHDLEPGGAVDALLAFVSREPPAYRTEAGPCYGRSCDHVSHQAR